MTLVAPCAPFALRLASLFSNFYPGREFVFSHDCRRASPDHPARSLCRFHRQSPIFRVNVPARRHCRLAHFAQHQRALQKSLHSSGNRRQRPLPLRRLWRWSRALHLRRAQRDCRGNCRFALQRLHGKHRHADRRGKHRTVCLPHQKRHSQSGGANFIFGYVSNRRYHSRLDSAQLANSSGRRRVSRLCWRSQSSRHVPTAQSEQHRCVLPLRDSLHDHL